MEIFNASHIPLLTETDILVVGAGSAGCVAALSAAKEGSKVALIERYGFPGGSSTQMLDTFYGFYTPGELPKKIVGGIASEVVDKLNEVGEVFLRPNTYGAGTGVNYHPERLKWVWDQMLLAAGVDLYLHTILLDVNDLNNRYECIVWTKGGILKIIAKYVIDASGDADFCHYTGFGYEIAGSVEPAQSMTTTFRMANVDFDTFEKQGGKTRLNQLMAEAFESGKYNLPRKSGSAHKMNIPSCISTVAVKVANKNGLNAKSLTEAEQEGRRQAFNYERFFRTEVPGYDNAKIIGLSNQIGVRETRRVYGKQRLTKAECMAAKVKEDAVFLCGAPVEDHRQGEDGADETYWEYVPHNGVYGVAYETLVPKEATNVWVVGRCFSATHDAHASCRSMAQTMSMGQAAGVAASIAVKTNSGTDIDINLLRNTLVARGVLLELPKETIKTGPKDWK